MTEHSLLFIIPLEEEFQAFREYFTVGKSISILPPFYYPISISSLDLHAAVGVIGQMGTSPAAAMAAQAISDLHPGIVIVTGIAASLDDDLRLGDVAIASQIFEYEAIGKTVPSGDYYTYQRSGYTFRTDSKLREIADHFRNNTSAYLDWQAAVGIQAEKENISHQQLPSQAAWPSLQVGFVASGNTVSAAGAYKGELKGRDRKLIALDMESAGVAHAIENSLYEPRLLVARGVSDWGDERKPALDGVGKGAWRRLAMFSACAFLDRFIRTPGVTYLIKRSRIARQQSEIIPSHAGVRQSTSFILKLSLSGRDAVGGMIAKSGIVGDQQMRQSFCLAIGIDSGSLRITELPPNQFGQALVQYIIDNQKANSWDALGDELRKHVEGKYLDTLNDIIEKAKHYSI